MLKHSSWKFHIVIEIISKVEFWFKSPLNSWSYGLDLHCFVPDSPKWRHQNWSLHHKPWLCLRGLTTRICAVEKRLPERNRKRFYVVRLFLLYSELFSSILKLRLVIIKRKNTFQKSSSILKWIKIEIFLAARKRSFIWHERKKWLHAFLWSYMNC